MVMERENERESEKAREGRLERSGGEFYWAPSEVDRGGSLGSGPKSRGRLARKCAPDRSQRSELGFRGRWRYFS